DKDQYNCLWVEHRDKGRLELNFVIPNIELLSGKRLQPYYYAAFPPIEKLHNHWDCHPFFSLAKKSRREFKERSNAASSVVAL
ncbi:relaxase/mobilization nuclease domain-containing protein, partial [Neisseria gonorrhoeae]|uniref:relaxase/mobilization nuclease domain-containing protein n=1 Tax=Neisseria gonorrhoeae TaxID=485 RepID=UPI001BCA55BE